MFSPKAAREDIWGLKALGQDFEGCFVNEIAYTENPIVSNHNRVVVFSEHQQDCIEKYDLICIAYHSIYYTKHIQKTSYKLTDSKLNIKQKQKTTEIIKSLISAMHQDTPV